MKKIITLAIMLLLSLSLISCWDNKLSSEEAWNQIEEIWKQIQNWDISEEEWMKMMQEISENSKKEKTWMDALKEQQDNVSNYNWIPDWAKDLWAIEPEGLTIDIARSSVTVEDAEKHMNEDFSAHYYWDADKLMIEAKKLIKAVNGRITDEQDDYLLAWWKLAWNHTLSVIVRTDIDKPFLDYSILWTKKF